MGSARSNSKRPVSGLIHCSSTSTFTTSARNISCEPKGMICFTRHSIDGGGMHYGGGRRRQAHLAELVVVPARTHSTPIGCAGQRGGCKVNDKLARALDYVVRMTLRTHRDITHRRVGTHRTCPRHGEDVLHVAIAATHQYGR